MSSQSEAPVRKRVQNGEWSGPPSKRNSPSISSLQRELQVERERYRRSQESVEQLRLEMQLMGRLFAAAREQIVALGGATLSPDVMVRVPLTNRPARSRSEAKALQRVQQELGESRGECKRLGEQVRQLRQKLQNVLATKQELTALVTEMHEYMQGAWSAAG